VTQESFSEQLEKPSPETGDGQESNLRKFLVRDKNTVQDYYNSWNKLDVVRQ
jgi:hypothetical protein